MRTLPEDTFLEIAAGRGSAAALDLLSASQNGRRLLLLRAVPDAAKSSGHPAAEQIAQAYDVLTMAQQTDRDTAAAVLRYPTVAAWSARALGTLAGRSSASAGANPAGLTAVAAAAAILTGTPAILTVPTLGGAVHLPALGATTAGSDDSFAVVRSYVDGAEIELAGRLIEIPTEPGTDGPGWQAVRQLSATYQGSSVRFSLDDQDPHRMPGAERTERRLPETEAARWQSMLAEAWEILVSRHSGSAAAVGSLISALTPLPSIEEGDRSATSKEAIGNIGLSAPRSPHGLAVTLAHEVQHVGLNALIDLVRLTNDDGDRRYYAPWRPDPRPLGGLLQGAYAHLGISAFWRTERHELSGAAALSAHTEFARWRTATALTIHTLLESDGLTSAGRLFITTMGDTVREWCAEPIPVQALDRARHAADQHLADWTRANGRAFEPAL